MSASDLASPDNAVPTKELDEELDSIDASLDAILSAAKEGSAAPVLGSDVEVPPPAEVEMAANDLAARAAPLGENHETPFPMIVEELPSYRADDGAADEAPAAEAAADTLSGSEAEAPVQSAPAESAEAGATLEAAPALSESAESADELEEIIDAEALVDSVTPAPELVAAEAAAATQESPAFDAPAATPPSDEEILDHVKLPPGSTPAPLATAAAALDQEGNENDEDRTVISPMPPVPEAAPLPPIRTWGSTLAESTGPVAPVPLLLSSQRDRDEGLTGKIGKLIGSKFQISVGMMALVVLGGAALGGGVVSLTKGADKAAMAPAAPTPTKVVEVFPPSAPAKAEPAAPTPAPAAAAVAAQPAEKPAPPKKVLTPSRKPAPTRVALAAPKPAAAAKPAAAPAAKPAAAKKPAQGAGWVDPFGQ